tara:strand:+ start:61 stop:810 length:750 start_codon:yes stop_codon:yes gene_type:complete
MDNYSKRLKLSDPNKEKSKESEPIWKKYLTTVGHTALDIGGMIPGVGAGADALNASWYASEGDTVNAALSTAAIVPGLGQISTGAKYLNKLKKTFGFGTSVKKAKTIAKETPYIPKELPNEGLINQEKLTSIINRSKSKGVIYDKNIGAGSDFVWKSNMFRKMPSIGGRKMVDVNPGGGIPSQRFYESTGLAGKKLADGSTSKGTWVPLEAFGTNRGIKKWFVKDKGWDQGYGSETFKNMGNLIKKMEY